MKAILVIIGLSAGNYFFQWVQIEPDYHVALYRSYFQFVAIITYISASVLNTYLLRRFQ
jgi:hypothetical protein